MVRAFAPGLMVALVSAAAAGAPQVRVGRGDTSCQVTAYRDPVHPADSHDATLDVATNPDGSIDYRVACAPLDYFRFAPGLSQSFLGHAWVLGYGHGAPGVLRAYLEAGTEVLPREYGQGYVAGTNPFRAHATADVGLTFDDVVTVPPSPGAMNPGDPTYVRVDAQLDCTERGMPPDYASFTRARIGLNVTTTAGPTSFQVYTDKGLSLRCPIAIGSHDVAAKVGEQVSLQGYIRLEAARLGVESAADQNGHHRASVDATSTAIFLASSAGGTPLAGAGGHVYADPGPLPPLDPVTTTTTLPPTPTPPAGCESACGNGMVDAGCGEACDCGMIVDPVDRAFGCAGADIVDVAPGFPDPEPADCVVCRGCQLLTYLCPAVASTSTTTTTTASTSTTPSTPTTTIHATTTIDSTTTSTMPPSAPCELLTGLRRAACDLGVVLDHPLCGSDAVPAGVGRVLRSRLGGARGAITSAIDANGKARTRYLRRARRALEAVRQKGNRSVRSHSPRGRITAACGTTLSGIVGAAEKALATP